MQTSLKNSQKGPFKYQIISKRIVDAAYYNPDKEDYLEIRKQFLPVFLVQCIPL